MDALGGVHTVFAFAALALGAAVVAVRKGTRTHRTLGHLYVSSMLGLNASAFFIYDLFGGFGPFHALAIVSLATVLAGLLPAVLRRPRNGWLDLHANFMSWSYVGLLAAALAEAAARLPGAPFAPAVIASGVVVSAVGAVVIHGRGGAVIRRALRTAGLVGVALVAVDPNAAGLRAGLFAQTPPPAAAALIDSARVAIERAVASGRGEELRTARALLEQARALDPENALHLHYEGYALYREAMLLPPDRDGDREELLERAQAALESSAARRALPETHALLSSVLGQRIGRSPLRGMTLGVQSSREMEKAVSLGPDNPRVALLRGMNAFHTPRAFGGGMDEARAQLERAVQLFETAVPAPPLPAWGRAEAYAWLGRVHRRQGDSARAREAFLKALEIDPDYAWVRDRLLPGVGPSGST